MTRKTPLPLLRNLVPHTLVVRCGLCHELVLEEECCNDSRLAHLCPSRGAVDALCELVPTTRLLYPLATSKLDA